MHKDRERSSRLINPGTVTGVAVWLFIAFSAMAFVDRIGVLREGINNKPSISFLACLFIMACLASVGGFIAGRMSKERGPYNGFAVGLIGSLIAAPLVANGSPLGGPIAYG